MLIGVMKINILLQGVDSLKGKRSIIKSLIGHIQSRFNASVAEIDRQDERTVAVIGLAVVSGEKQHVESQLDTILNFVRGDGRFYLGQIEREIFPAGL
jgi:uncharacterized protein